MADSVNAVDDSPCASDGGRCSDCGSCVNHDGCADEEHPLQPGDCGTCGACSQCLGRCVPDAALDTDALLTPRGLAESAVFEDGAWRDPEGRTLFHVLADAIGRDQATELWRKACDLFEITWKEVRRG